MFAMNKKKSNNAKDGMEKEAKTTTTKYCQCSFFPLDVRSYVDNIALNTQKT